MKVFYVAGPYKSITAYDREINIRKAEKASMDVLSHIKDSAVICPHTMGRFWYEAIDESVVLQMCIELLRRSDAIVLSQVPELCIRSFGTMNEIAEAIKLRIPIYHSTDDFHLNEPKNSFWSSLDQPHS